MFHSSSRLVISSGALIALLIVLAASPAAGAPLDKFENSYLGFLEVELTCSMPQFVCSARMDVTIDPDGTVLISDVEMPFGGSEDLQDGCVYERTGNWSIMPTGMVMDGPPAHIAVDENIVFDEHIIMTCPIVGEVINETPSGNLNEGLAFDWVDALMDGAVIEVVNGNGDLLRWTLGLVVKVPTGLSSWSAIKALYGGDSSTR